MDKLKRTLVRVAEAPDSSNAIVCIPQAGAGVSSFVPLAKELSGTASVWAARFPGHEGRTSERLLTSIEKMATELIDAVRDIEVTNIVLFGYCSGAYVAYELAHLLAIGNRTWPNAWLALAAQEAPPSSRPEPGAHPPALPDLLREMGGTSEAFFQSQELMELLIPVIEADFRAAWNYHVPQQRARLTVPIAVLSGKDDHFLRAPQLQAWRERTARTFRMEFFDGGHFFLSNQVSAVSRLLLSLLDG
jgi:medium-chain acyl-[acyl-carrier-protein] hydrolase